ncbi:hypothetical protein C0389_04335 [bacterium]|nr:hypothetical protein [bacterium]
MEELIPIIMFLVTGLVIVTYIYFRSKEKQMMIEKGLSIEQMMELLRTKRDPYLMLKLGIIILFVGLGIGLGFLFQQWTGYNVQYGSGADKWTDHDVQGEWMGFWVVAMTGLGFIIAFLATRKLKNGSN